MPKIVDLKSTLNLPRTAFPMKASLPQNEPKQLAEWEEKKLYHRIQQARAVPGAGGFGIDAEFG